MLCSLRFLLQIPFPSQVESSGFRPDGPKNQPLPENFLAKHAGQLCSDGVTDAVKRPDGAGTRHQDGPPRFQFSAFIRPLLRNQFFQSPLPPLNPLFPTHRSVSNAVSGAARQKQIPSSQTPTPRADALAHLPYQRKLLTLRRKISSLIGTGPFVQVWNPHSMGYEDTQDSCRQRFLLVGVVLELPGWRSARGGVAAT